MGFVPPVAVGFTVMDYLMAVDTLVNLESRLKKLQDMSEGYITVIREEYKVPHPFDKLAFAFLSFLVLIIS